MKIVITNDTEGKRIDVFLQNNLEKSRSLVQKKIIKEEILVNEKPTKSNYLLKENDEITIISNNIPLQLKPLNNPLKIIYEDEFLAIICKDNGVVVHPGNGLETNTLTNTLLYHFNELSNINEERPGIVHRLDAYTTGIMVIAKTNDVHYNLSQQFKDQKVKRVYYALVEGVIYNNLGTINAPLGRDPNNRLKYTVISKNSKRAVTYFKVLKRYKEATLVEITLETGRTHQIRAHFEYIGHSIINDPVYNKRKVINNDGQCLHAKILGFKHPKTEKYVEFECELPLCFVNVLEQFK